MKILLAQIQDIADNGSIVVKGPQGQDIALFRQGHNIYALDNRCPHMEGPLGEGTCEEGIVTCPWHGWQFRLDDGSCLNMPGVDASPVTISVEGDQIFLI